MLLDAGSAHGPQLAHLVEAPPCAGGGGEMELRSLTLMFRGHYGEPPLELLAAGCVPAPGREEVYELEYVPARGAWGEPRRVEGDGACAKPVSAAA